MQRPDDLDKLEQLYRTDLGPSGCIQYGDGQFYETDRRGDVADETTFGSDKLDYWFVSIQRYNANYGGTH